VAGQHEAREQRQHLEIRHLDRAGVALVPDMADQVVPAVRLAFCHHIEDVVVQVEQPLRLLLRLAGMVNVPRPEEEPQRRADPLGAIRIQPDDVADHLQRQRERE